MRVLTNVYSKPGSWHVNMQVSKLLMSLSYLLLSQGRFCLISRKNGVILGRKVPCSPLCVCFSEGDTAPMNLSQPDDPLCSLREFNSTPACSPAITPGHWQAPEKRALCQLCCGPRHILSPWLSWRVALLIHFCIDWLEVEL